MKKTLLAVAALLAACNDTTPEVPAEQPAAEARSGSGTGIITAVNAAAGTVTIEHGPMPAIGWSAMTMTFDADPALLAGVGAGDAVAFDVTVSDGDATVTALTVQ